MSFAQSYERTVLELSGVLDVWSEVGADERSSYLDEFEWVLLHRREERDPSLVQFDQILMDQKKRVRRAFGLDVVRYLARSAAVENAAQDDWTVSVEEGHLAQVG